MGAGDGKAEQSRLAAERVARLKHRLDEAEGATKPWDADAVSEKVVADKLGELVPRGWYVLHDVHWPGRPKASLDHVLVGPGGVVVVDCKNWTGEVRVLSGVLWQGRYAACGWRHRGVAPGAGPAGGGGTVCAAGPGADA